MKFVLFMDILGFSNLVLKNTPQDLKQIYDSELHQTTNMIPLLSATTFERSVKFNIISEQNGKLSEVRQNEINLHIMSDTVIAWTNDDSFNSLLSLSEFASTYLAMMVSLGLPHRGGISKGKIQSVKLPLNGKLQSNIVGEGVVKAHIIENKQNWMGCSIDKICFEGYENELHKLLEQPKSPIVMYDVPFKSNAEVTTRYTINWTLFDALIKNKDLDYFKEQFNRHNKGLEGVEAKILNTYKFYAKMNHQL